MTERELVDLCCCFFFPQSGLILCPTCYVLEMMYEMRRTPIKCHRPVCVYRLEVRRDKISYLQAKKILQKNKAHSREKSVKSFLQSCFLR